MTNAGKPRPEEHVIEDTARPEDEELVHEALKQMRKLNEALAAVARRGWAIPLNLESGTVGVYESRRTRAGVSETYKRTVVHPARLTAFDPFKPKVEESDATHNG